jgi:GAF domain-containing protein
MMALQSALPALPDAVALGPGAVLDLLAHRVADRVGYSLMTILVPAPDGRLLLRIFSSNLHQYPLGDADIVEDTIWFRQLFGACSPVIANDAEEIAAWLPGFDGYVEQGYGSLANVPVVVAGRTVGILNLMADVGHFTPDRIAALREELPMAALAILAEGRSADA